MLPDHKKIKMRALDQKGLLHIAEQLRDGLCPLMSMVYEKNTFTMLVNRFCWNHEDMHENKSLYYRAHLGLMFMHVVSVERKGFSHSDKMRILNLLHIEVEEGDEFKTITLLFSNSCDIKLTVKKIEIYTSDLHDAWPTKQKPTHIHEHLEQMAV
jgi:hypothetical protein